MKIAIISPHLSTGGLPKYLLWFVKNLIKLNLDITIIEFSNISDIYVVQKNEIKELVKIVTLSDDKNGVLNVLKELNPDVIHFMEIPELFISYELTKEIYNSKCFVIETTHTSTFDIRHKRFIPDKFIFPCSFSQQQYKSFKVPSEVIEYTHETSIKLSKDYAQKVLDFDPSYKHVINVGLFTPGKNQKEIIELAAKMLNYKIVFHFIGNLADNFKNYWGPLVKELPKNCKIWGERSDMDTFYSAADLMFFTSTEELNPLCIKEAIYHKLKIFCYNLPTYLNKYSQMDGVYFISKNDLNSNWSKLLELLDIEKISYNIQKTPTIKIVHLLSLPKTEREIKSVKSIAPLAQFPGIQYVQHVNPPTTILPENFKQKDRPSLTAGHLGCYSAFKKAIQEEFDDDVDFLLICEGDCKLLTNHKEFYSGILKACEEIDKNGIAYFSFGDTRDLEVRVFQMEPVIDGFNSDFCFQTIRIIGLQSIMFPKSEKDYLNQQFNEEPWTGPDIWFNNVFRKPNKKMAVVKKRFTTQFDGTSLIDNQPKKLL